MSNKMQQVAELIGVQMGERFKVKDARTGHTYPEMYEITEKGIKNINTQYDAERREGGVCWQCEAGELHRLMTGVFEVVKIPPMQKAMEAHDEFLRGRFLRVE